MDPEIIINDGKANQSSIALWKIFGIEFPLINDDNNNKKSTHTVHQPGDHSSLKQSTPASTNEKCDKILAGKGEKEDGKSCSQTIQALRLGWLDKDSLWQEQENVEKITQFEDSSAATRFGECNAILAVGQNGHEILATS